LTQFEGKLESRAGACTRLASVKTRTQAIPNFQERGPSTQKRRTPTDGSLSSAQARVHGFSVDLSGQRSVAASDFTAPFQRLESRVRGETRRNATSAQTPVCTRKIADEYLRTKTAERSARQLSSAAKPWVEAVGGFRNPGFLKTRIGATRQRTRGEQPRQDCQDPIVAS
jgi:hypothetical protein